jgi:thioesterase domain-containing protein/acyl carrier protein
MSSGTAHSRQVCVLGSGAAGLGAAWALERAGHRAIVLETLDDVGGRAWGEPAEHAGRSYDLGGQRNPPQSHRLGHLAAELGVATEAAPPARTLDAGNGERPGHPGSLRRAIAAYVPLRQHEFPRIGEAGLTHSAYALAQPVSQWLAERELSTVATVVGPSHTTTGHGRLDGDLPAIYFAKYIETTGILSTQPPALGHPHGFLVAGGVQRLWDRLAAKLSDVRCGVQIRHIARAADGVTVYTDTGTLEADDLVVALSFNQALSFLDASDEERDIAARVRYVDFCAALCTISGLPADIADAIMPAAAIAPPGQCVGLQRLSPDQDMFTCYCYGADGMSTDDILAALHASIDSFGSRLERVHVVRRRRRMPHFGSDDIRNGIYERIEVQQGQQHTYIAGALPAFTLVESSLAYSQELVNRFFGGSAAPAGRGPVGQAHAAPAAALPVEALPTYPAAVGVSAAALRGWLVNRIAELICRPAEEVDPNAPLDGFGLHSLSAVTLISELSEWCEKPLESSLLIQFPTIESIVSHLTAGDSKTVAAVGRGQSASTLFQITTGQPFFCFPGAHGTAFYLVSLAREVGSARPFYGLHTPGYDRTEKPLRAVPPLAARQLEQIRRFQPYGPYLLGGHSFGGIVAYEIARQLREEGEVVTRVVMLDTCIWRPRAAPDTIDDDVALAELLDDESDADVPPWIGPGLTLVERKELLEHYLGHNVSLGAEEQADTMMKVYRASIEAGIRYQPPPSDLDVVLFRAAGSSRGTSGPMSPLQISERAAGWEQVGLRSLQIIEVPGDHETMLFQPNSAALATALHTCLSEAPRPNHDIATGATTLPPVRPAADSIPYQELTARRIQIPAADRWRTLAEEVHDADGDSFQPHGSGFPRRPL